MKTDKNLDYSARMECSSPCEEYSESWKSHIFYTLCYFLHLFILCPFCDITMAYIGVHRLYFTFS